MNLATSTTQIPRSTNKMLIILTKTTDEKRISISKVVKFYSWTKNYGNELQKENCRTGNQKTPHLQSINIWLSSPFNVNMLPNSIWYVRRKSDPYIL